MLSHGGSVIPNFQVNYKHMMKIENFLLFIMLTLNVFQTKKNNREIKTAKIDIV